MRLSFCCAREGCRRRTTPPSVRYLGRRVYLGAVVVLATAMQAGITAARATGLRDLLGVSVPTLKRWRRWWQESFVTSAFWRAAKARVMPPVATAGLPSSLLERFVGDEQTRLLHTLKFLCPMTTPAGGLGARLAMAAGNPQKMFCALPWPRP